MGQTFSRRAFFVAIGLASSTILAAQLAFPNPILPGDHPDPTIVRAGGTYWTTSTSGDWAPQFALFRSADLHRWTPAGFIFPHTPAWAAGDFWAPELVLDQGRTLVYYVARKRDGPLCVAAATAATPAGPYTDQGPIVCQPDGSIDPAFARDEAGEPFLIWKEDGNSRSQPTVLWAQPLTPDLIHLTGTPTQLLVNDPATWEGGVVEAPYILRHAGMFYLFYAANGCCGVDCRYAEGVARAPHLLGPWIRDPANPIIAANATWRCPGHGTAVQTPTGDDLFLYHAYPAQSHAYLGRESVLDRITWNADGWPEINHAAGPGTTPARASLDFSDAFASAMLDPGWRWPVGHEPHVSIAGSRLALTVPETGTQSFIARSLLTLTYTASIGIPSGGSAGGGIALIGDAQDDIVLSREPGFLELWQSDKAGRHPLWKQPITASGTIWLRAASDANGRARFSYRIGAGAWLAAGESVELKGLLPWDSGLRVGLVADGGAGTRASFTRFTLNGVP